MFYVCIMFLRNYSVTGLRTQLYSIASVPEPTNLHKPPPTGSTCKARGLSFHCRPKGLSSSEDGNQHQFGGCSAKWSPRWDGQSGGPEFDYWLLWPLASYLTTLNLSFPSHRRRPLVMSTSQSLCKHETDYGVESVGHDAWLLWTLSRW